MIDAPTWGTGAVETKEKPRRVGPAGLNKSSSSHTTACSAPAPLRQETERTERPRILSSTGKVVEAGDANLLVALKRIKGIIRLLRSRHGPSCEGPQASVYFEAIAPQIMIAKLLDPNFGQEPADWARKYTPNLSAAEQARIMAGMLRFPPEYHSTKLGEMLCLTDDEREAGKFWWAAAVDVTPEQMRARKVAKANERMKALRASRGSIPWERSLSRTEPWVAMGISRRTYERRRATGKL